MGKYRKLLSFYSYLLLINILDNQINNTETIYKTKNICNFNFDKYFLRCLNPCRLLQSNNYFPKRKN